MARLGIPLTLLALLLQSPVSADSLGRLFSTPADRARIDDIRAGRASASVSADTEQVDHLLLNGTLTGSNGKRLAWVNGIAVDPDQPDTDITLLYDGRARMTWRGGEAVRTLKPGQGLDKATGEVFENYARPVTGSVVTTPIEPAAPNVGDR